MCGRYSTGGDEVPVEMEGAARTFYFEPRYNAAPTQTLPIILLEKGKLIAKEMKWGFRRRTGELIIRGKSETIKLTFAKYVPEPPVNLQDCSTRQVYAID